MVRIAALFTAGTGDMKPLCAFGFTVGLMLRRSSGSARSRVGMPSRREGRVRVALFCVSYQRSTPPPTRRPRFLEEGGVRVLTAAPTSGPGAGRIEFVIPRCAGPSGWNPLGPGVRIARAPPVLPAAIRVMYQS